MIDKPSAPGPAAAASFGKEGLAGLAPGAARAMLEKAATGFPSSPSAVTMPLPPSPGILAVQVTLSAAALARLASRPELANRLPVAPSGLALEPRQAIDPHASGIPLTVEQARRQLPQGDRPIPQEEQEPSPGAEPEPESPAQAPPGQAQKTPLPTAYAGPAALPAAPPEQAAAPAPNPTPAQGPGPPQSAAAPAPVRKLVGLVTDSSVAGRATVLTAEGPVTVPTPLPLGARVEIALSGTGYVLLSLLLPPSGPVVNRRDEGRAGRAPAPGTPGPAAEGGSADESVLPADRRLGAALFAIGQRLLFSAGPHAPGAETAATVLWFGTPEQPVPLSMEMVPMQAENRQEENGLEEEGAGGGRRSTRFRFGLRLDGVGALQLDGMMRQRRFDLRVSTEKALGSQLEQELTRIFQGALDLGGLGGSIAFAGRPDAWSHAHVMVSPVTA